VQAQAAPPGLRPVDLPFLETKRLVLASVGVNRYAQRCMQHRET
jgi:hypothetical protein